MTTILCYVPLTLHEEPHDIYNQSGALHLDIQALYLYVYQYIQYTPNYGFFTLNP